MKLISTSVLSCSIWVAATLPTAAMAQNSPAPAGQVVVDSVNRLFLNPVTTQVLLTGYFASIEGLPGPLFSGVPSESTAHFTWSSASSGATVLPNGDIAGVVLNSGENFNVYYNPSPNQSWNNPGSFSAGQLVATSKLRRGHRQPSGRCSW